MPATRAIQRPLVFSVDRAEALKEIQRSAAFSVDPAKTREGIFPGLKLVTEEEAAAAMARKPCTRPRRLHKDCSALPDP